MILRGLRQIRAKLGPLWWYSGLVFVAGQISSLLNAYLMIFLLPQQLSKNELGAVDPLIRLTAMGALPLSVISVVGTKYISAYCASGAGGKIKLLLRDLSLLALAASVIFAVALFFSYPALQIRLNLQGRFILPSLVALAVCACWQPLLNVIFQGTQRFGISSISGLTGASMRVVLALMLVPVLHLAGYMVASFLAGFLAILIGVWGLRDLIHRDVPYASYYADMRGMLGFGLAVGIYLVATSFQYFLEPFVVKHRLLALDAAGYYLVCRFGSIPAFLIGAISFVVFPMFSHRHERGESTAGYLRQALLGTLLIAGSATVVVGLAAGFIFGLRPEWRQYLDYAPYVWRIGIMTTLDSLIAIYTLHEIACRRFEFVRLILPVIVIECVVLYCSFGWGAFQRSVPPAVWQAVATWLPNTLSCAVNIFVIFRIVQVLLLLSHWLWKSRADNQSEGDT
jgi:hypothetical protein